EFLGGGKIGHPEEILPKGIDVEKKGVHDRFQGSRGITLEDMGGEPPDDQDLPGPVFVDGVANDQGTCPFFDITDLDLSMLVQLVIKDLFPVHLVDQGLVLGLGYFEGENFQNNFYVNIIKKIGILNILG